MGNEAVTKAHLGRLVWFLNLKDEVLENWDRALAPVGDAWDNRFLYWNSSEQDTGESLIKLRNDLRSDIDRLVNPDAPAGEALGKILDRIDALQLVDYKIILTAEKVAEREVKGEPFRTVNLVRVRPPAKGEERRRKPLVETVAFSENRLDENARPNFYRIIDDAIRNDTISDVRRCLSSKTFFLKSKVGGLTYCSKKCETKFNNDRRIKSGYFKDRRSNPETKEAKQSPRIFLQFRTIALNGPKTSLEREKVESVASWLHFDIDRDSFKKFKLDCQKLAPDAHWRTLRPFLKKRFESYA